jgi:DNA-binding NtrC family response regulator
VGTTFTVWLPACGETALPPVDDVSELQYGNGESVLIVDDEAALVHIAEETLAHLGYYPAGFTSSLAALDACRAEPGRYDLVLTDETMPDLTGCQLAREIHKLRPDLPVMLMSGHRGAHLAAGAQAAGVAGILYKPLLRRDFAESIANALRMRACAGR